VYQEPEVSSGDGEDETIIEVATNSTEVAEEGMMSVDGDDLAVDTEVAEDNGEIEVAEGGDEEVTDDSNDATEAPAIEASDDEVAENSDCTDEDMCVELPTEAPENFDESDDEYDNGV
jgi:hypothetical protein